MSQEKRTDLQQPTRPESPESLGMSTDQSQPMHPRDLSPYPWPPEVGEVVILYTSPDSKTRGYVGLVEQLETNSGRYSIRLLDSTDKTLILSALELIPTGKTPAELVAQYQPSDLDLSKAVETERSLPDFSKLKTKKTKAQPKPKTLNQALKSLSEDQTKALARLLMLRIKETQNENH